MHTKKLQEVHSATYESFFAHQKIIISTPFVLSRSSDSDVWYSGISIKQKIPLRMYVGVCSDPKPGLHFGEITYRDITEHTYITLSLQEYAPFFSQLEKTIAQQFPNREKGYRLNILSELSRGAGAGFDSICCLLLSGMTHRLQGLRDGKTQNDMPERWDDLNDAASPRYNIVRYAHTLESQIRGYQYMSGAIVASLCDSGFPIMSFNEDTPHTGKTELVTVADYKCFAYPLNILFPQAGETPHIPIDYGLIYSGRPTLSEHVGYQTTQNETSDFMEFAYNTFKTPITQSNACRKPKFYKQLIKEHEKGNDTIVQSLLGYMSFEIGYRLKTVYEKGYTEDDIKKLILAITKTRHAHNAVKRSSTHLTGLINGLQQYFGYRSDLLGISYNDTNSMGGSLLFTTPVEGLRRNLLNTTNQAQRDFPGVELIYANWLDGIEFRGLVCEQDLIQQKTSSFVDSNLLVLETPNQNYVFGCHDELVQHKEVDIILDTIHMKIYIQGQKLTSKDLHSQTGTIEMLMTALPQIGSDISNKQLPLSTYSKSKNDMVGKIIIPLTKLVKDKVKKDLPIDCYGGMYDYFLRLKKHNVRFGVVRKVVDTTMA